MRPDGYTLIGAAIIALSIILLAMFLAPQRTSEPPAARRVWVDLRAGNVGDLVQVFDPDNAPTAADAALMVGITQKSGLSQPQYVATGTLSDGETVSLYTATVQTDNGGRAPLWFVVTVRNGRVVKIQ